MLPALCTPFSRGGSSDCSPCCYPCVLGKALPQSVFHAWWMREGSLSLLPLCTQGAMDCLSPSPVPYHVPLVAKPCLGHPSTSPTLNAARGLLPSGLEMVSEGPSFVHLGVLNPRVIWKRTHSICTIYSQLGTNHFKLRN